ncbi:MAG: YdgA family protein [Legionella sp.]|uniref:YdgA family protein n=1 Tax=Legionella sp. TaxID=459 RepID=UPI0039E6E5B1
MKKLAGLVIILAALLVGGYYGMGVLTEKTIKKNIEVMDQSNGLHAQIDKYDRGLFSSEAKINWQLHIPARVVTDANGQTQSIPSQDFKMDMPLTIHHGPIILTNHGVRFGLGYAESVFPFPKQYEDQFDATFSKESTKPQLDMSIFVNYFNQSTLDAKVPQFKLFTKEGNGQIDWLGMNATNTMSPEMKKVDGTLTLDGVHVSKGDSTLNLGQISTEYNLHKTDSGLYLGSANFDLPSFSSVDKGQKVFAITDLVFKSDSDIKEHLFSTSLTLSVKSILVNAKTYGPGDFAVAIRNLDADVLAKINQQAAAMQNAPDAQRQQAVIALLPEIPKLFSKGAEFEISKFNLTLPEGQVDGNLFVSLPKQENANPFELMQKIQGKARLKVPAAAVKSLVQQSVVQQMARQPDYQNALVQQLQGAQTTTNQGSQPTTPSIDQLAAIQADKQLNALQQNGLIITQGSDYLIEVSLEQGKFIVNGKPFDSSMLKF